MLLGIPVVASDLPAVREITGNAAVYVAPGDPEQLAESVTHVVEGTYDHLDAAAWASQLTWDETSIQLRRLYSGRIPSS